MKKRYQSSISRSLSPTALRALELEDEFSKITDYIKKFNEESQENIVLLESQLLEYQKQMEGRELTPELQEKYDGLVVKMNENIQTIKDRIQINLDELSKVDNAGSLIDKAEIIQKLEGKLNGYITGE